ncbi:hypothetical protein SAMN02745121_00224 [Nannocystis exedens]|uniref:Uncharacterized protein n=1 Tax=Nannocystis exedens TaxID=54 RepID=A0A1I1SZ01_9BACT|nr:hypothetical protein [Nannocystis exedens]PCC75684.1 hypothetical protein NAEX_08796 [Nannocystis exedens]SFD49163.1 hypothetical protein SAMN02745121_00224 [Nannocystis exedens]
MRASALRRIGQTVVCVVVATTGTNCAPHGHETIEMEAAPQADWTVARRTDCPDRRLTAPTSSVDAEDEGSLDAALDLARGVLALESYEQPRACHARLAERLRLRYDIDYRNVGACGVDPAVIGHARGYNAMMHRHIAERHGAVVEAVAREVGCLRDG